MKVMDETDRFHFERELWSRGVTRVAGVDEAGRGPLAGPVAAAAVIFPAAEPKKLGLRACTCLLRRLTCRR